MHAMTAVIGTVIEVKASLIPKTAVAQQSSSALQLLQSHRGQIKAAMLQFVQHSAAYPKVMCSVILETLWKTVCRTQKGLVLKSPVQRKSCKTLWEISKKEKQNKQKQSEVSVAS